MKEHDVGWLQASDAAARGDAGNGIIGDLELLGPRRYGVISHIAYKDPIHVFDRFWAVRRISAT